MLKELEANGVAYISKEEDIGTSCIICDGFIKLENPFARSRRNDEYICQECKDFIVFLKQVGYQRIINAVMKTESMK